MQKINLEVFKILKSKKLTISFCESASAGALSSFFSEIEGVSEVFKGALITYSNEAKINIAKIDPQLIALHGAVSKEVAEAMSANTNKILKTDICISITGNASNNVIENKIPSLYYVGITIIDKTYVYEIKLDNVERNYNRFNIAWTALSKLNAILNI